MRQLVAGNWKMNGTTATTVGLINTLRDGAHGLSCDLLICPPFTQLAAAHALLAGSPIQLGGQTCHPAVSGAHTGDISAEMLADIGCTHVILGHSERRQNHFETSAIVLTQVGAAQRAGLHPIVCVGETEAERNAGAQNAIIETQLRESLPPDFAGTIAYEPIWAIGTGRTASPADVAAMHHHIRVTLGALFGEPGIIMRILYGGSVNATNAANLLAIANVNGALVGGASLHADAFLAIAGAARKEDLTCR